MCRGTRSTPSPPHCQCPCSRLISGVPPVKVNKPLWAAARIPEGQRELRATKDDFKQVKLVLHDGLDKPSFWVKEGVQRCCCLL